jgi:VanZ family protein
MLPLRYARRWQTAGILILISVLAATLSPTLPDFQQSKILNDKWLHGLTFVFLTVWFSGQYARRSYWRLGLGMLAFGGLIEVCQRMLTYRSAETMDLLADTIGIVAGLAVALAGAGGWSLRLENWLQWRH